MLPQPLVKVDVWFATFPYNFLFLHEHVLSHQAIGGVREFFQSSYFPGKWQKLDPFFSEWGSSNYFEII